MRTLTDRTQPEVDIFSLSVRRLSLFVEHESKQDIQIHCVRQKCSIKRDVKLPVASYDVRDVSVLVAHACLLGEHLVNRAFFLLARIQTDSAWME